MAAIIYTLCALTSLACAYLLLAAYSRTKARLLLWSGLCFTGLTANNVILVLDRIFLAQADLTTLRLSVAFIALLVMLYGLIWEKD